MIAGFFATPFAAAAVGAAMLSFGRPRCRLVCLFLVVSECLLPLHVELDFLAAVLVHVHTIFCDRHEVFLHGLFNVQTSPNVSAANVI